jgi:hypothetical protein
LHSTIAEAPPGASGNGIRKTIRESGLPQTAQVTDSQPFSSAVQVVNAVGVLTGLTGLTGFFCPSRTGLNEQIGDLLPTRWQAPPILSRRSKKGRAEVGKF